MNESGINFTTLDIKDEINLQEQDFSFFSKKKLTYSAIEFTDNNNISEIKINKDLHNVTNTEASSQSMIKIKNCNFSDRSPKINENTNIELKEKQNENAPAPNKSEQINDDIKKKNEKSKNTEATVKNMKASSISKSITSFPVSKLKINNIVETKKTKPNLSLKTDKCLPTVNELGKVFHINRQNTFDSKKFTPQTTKNKNGLLPINPEKKNYFSTKINRKTNSVSSLTMLNKFKQTSHFNSNKTTYLELISNRIDEIFDNEFINNYNAHIQNTFNFLLNNDKHKENGKDELIEFIDSIYAEKISKIIEIGEKYDCEIIKLKEMVDLNDISNVNNIIYYSIVNDKKDDMKQLEDEFKIKKEEGINNIKNNLKMKVMSNLQPELNKEMKTEFINYLKNKIVLSLRSVDTNKMNLSGITIKSSRDKKSESNSTINSGFYATESNASDLNYRKNF